MVLSFDRGRKVCSMTQQLVEDSAKTVTSVWRGSAPLRNRALEFLRLLSPRTNTLSSIFLDISFEQYAASFIPQTLLTDRSLQRWITLIGTGWPESRRRIVSVAVALCCVVDLVQITANSISNVVLQSNTFVRLVSRKEKVLQKDSLNFVWCSSSTKPVSQQILVCFCYSGLSWTCLSYAWPSLCTHRKVLDYIKTESFCDFQRRSQARFDVSHLQDKLFVNPVDQIKNTSSDEKLGNYLTFYLISLNMFVCFWWQKTSSVF